VHIVKYCLLVLFIEYYSKLLFITYEIYCLLDTVAINLSHPFLNG
jgi:hypothetical protein